jgi:hypothetical protein
MAKAQDTRFPTSLLGCSGRLIMSHVQLNQTALGLRKSLSLAACFRLTNSGRLVREEEPAYYSIRVATKTLPRFDLNHTLELRH